jgi:DNA polymerase/3'-5' exonuclease PolX
MTTPDKKRFPRALALQVARELVRALEPAAERIIVAGSLRRMKKEVGDVEILYIPKLLKDQPHPADMFRTVDLNLADGVISLLEKRGVLAKRENKIGGFTFGPLNKLMLHCESQVPVDLFAATALNWYNYLVCRTGSAANNTRIAQKAQELGLKWHPYNHGFTRADGTWIHVTTEEQVFTTLSLPYLEPKDR